MISEVSGYGGNDVYEERWGRKNKTLFGEAVQASPERKLLEGNLQSWERETFVTLSGFSKGEDFEHVNKPRKMVKLVEDKDSQWSKV